MDIQPIEQEGQVLSDDQELAKVLAGVDDSSSGDDVVAPAPAAPTLPPPTADGTMPDPLAGDVGSAASTPEPAVELDLPPMPPVLPKSQAAPAAVDSELESIKQEALGELRPLVDKLNVSPEEKFDTYLLLLRSTDDRELIAPAHEAAKSITDESRKAQALFDIIKEIDFLSQNQQPEA